MKALVNKETVTSRELLEQINMFREQEGKSKLENYDLKKIIRKELKKDFDENDFVDYKWFRALRKIFEKNNQSLNKDLLENELSIDLAQKILNYPIERAFNSLKDENDGDDEE